MESKIVCQQRLTSLERGRTRRHYWRYAQVYDINYSPSPEVGQSRKHLDPKSILREAIEVEADLDGGLAVVVDCGGVGHGLWQDLREAGLDTFGVRLTTAPSGRCLQQEKS